MANAHNTVNTVHTCTSGAYLRPDAVIPPAIEAVNVVIADLQVNFTTKLLVFYSNLFLT